MNIFTERLWCTVKYELIDLNDTGAGLYRDLSEYFTFYNERRLHQGLGYRTPAEVYPAAG